MLLTITPPAWDEHGLIRLCNWIKAKIYIHSESFGWNQFNRSRPIWTDNMMTFCETFKRRWDISVLCFISCWLQFIIETLVAVWKFILFGKELLSAFGLCLTPWRSFLTITKHLWNVASSFSFLISPDHSSHYSSCLFGHCSTWLAGLKMSALGLYREMFGQ